MPILNVEADELLYRAAFSSQNVAYILIKGGKRIDLGYQREMYNFNTKKVEVINLTKTYIIKEGEKKGKELGVDYELETYIVPKPVEYCLGRLKDFLFRLENHGELRLFLTSSDHSNFRYGIVKTEGPKGLGYKAGRPPRPVHYQAAREYLLKRGAEEIFGYEADDALCMYQNNNTIAVHIDKDINMAPGKHLNWVTMEFYDVPEGLGTVTINDKGKAVGRGVKYFYHQLLTGDATDNILGIKGIGDKTAYTILKDIDDEYKCFVAVYEIYQDRYGEDATDILNEMADLLWMVGSDKRTGRQYLENSFKVYYGVYP